MTRKTLLITAALLALCPLAACTTPTATSATPRADLAFTKTVPLQLNIGSVQMNDAHRGEVTTKTDLHDVSVSIGGDNTDIAVDSVVIE